MQQGLQLLKNNKLLEALVYFDQHKPFEEAAKVLIKYSLTQDLKTREFILSKIVKQIKTPKIKLDCLNLLGCSLGDKEKQIEIFHEALQLAQLNELNPSATLINLTCVYSKLGQHDKSLQLALQSTNCAVGKQQVIAYHNAAIEYQFLQELDMSNQYHKRAYQLSVELFGEDDVLTQKMSKYYVPTPLKKIIPCKQQFRLRSASKQREQSKTFYYKRNASRNDSHIHSTNQSQLQPNSGIKVKVNSFLQQSKLIYDSDEEVEKKETVEGQQLSFLQSVKLLEQINKQQKSRLQFITSIHNQNILKIEKRLSRCQINVSQNSIVQQHESQDFIHFENQHPDGKFDSMIPLQQQEELTQDDQEFLLKQIQGIETNKDNTVISLANQDTVDNTFELNNRKRAACKIQNWFRNRPRVKVLSINLSKRQNAAKKIQKNIRMYKCKRTYQLAQQSQFKLFSVLKKMRIEQEEKYVRIIGKQVEDSIHYTILELTDKKHRKKAKKYIQIFKCDELQKKYKHFDEFNSIVLMPDQINNIAKKQKGELNLKELCSLFYLLNKTVHLYGVTDTLFLEEEDEKQQQVVTPKIAYFKLSKLLKLQSLLRGYLARKKQEIILKQIYKKKRFIEKVSGKYLQIIFKAENIIQCYNIELKRFCENELEIPELILKFYGSVTRQNCSEILSIDKNVLHFSEDAQYLIDRDRISKQQHAPSVLEKAAKKLQRAYRSKLKIFNNTILQHKKRAAKKEITTLFLFRKACLFDQRYHIMLTAAGQVVKGNQQLMIEGGISTKHYQTPSVISQCQRLFIPLDINDFMQITRIILEEIRFVEKTDRIHLQCYSIEEVYGFLKQREFNTFKESQSAKNSKEPTLLGRHYLSTKIYCKQYLQNRFELEDRPQVFCENYDTSRYQIAYIKNRYLELKNKQYQQRMNEKHITNINEYVNSFPSVFTYEWIIDPEELFQRQLEKSAKTLQRAFRLLKFRLQIHLRIEQRRRRKLAMLEAQKVVEKLYYYDEIRKVQPYSTTEILERRGEAVIPLKQILENSIMTEWIIVLPYQDIVVTVYSNPRKFYQIKYKEYTNHYLDIILSEPIDKIQSYFCAALEKFSPENKLELISELREQFSRKVIRAVRLKLFCKKLRDMPLAKKFLIKSFVNEFYVKINYFYQREEQKILILLQKERHKRKYYVELFYLDCLYANYHLDQSVYLDRSQFIQLLTLNEPKSYHKYRKLLMPLINIFHNYLTVNSFLEAEYEFKEHKIPVTEILIQYDKCYTSSQGFHMYTQESVQRLLPTTILIQSKWRQYKEKQKFLMKLCKCRSLKLKLMANKGKEMQKTFVKRSDISDEKDSKLVYLCIIYQAIESNMIKMRVELISYRGSVEQKLYNIFLFDQNSTIINEPLSQFLLKNLYIENNTLILKQKFQDHIKLEQTETKSVRLITKRANSPKLIYHHKRQYSNGTSFVYEAVHTGEAPSQKLVEANTIKLDIDLNEFKSQYPQINYEQSNILPKISEQLISGLKINKSAILSKQMISRKGFRVSGVPLVDEGEKEINFQPQKQQNKMLLRFTQFYKKSRYMITISQLDIPIESNEGWDKIYEPYQSFINVIAHNQITNDVLQWQMNLLQAQEITNLKVNKDIAYYIRQNMLVLNKQFIFVADFKRYDFENVLMFQRQTILLIQRMVKNRRFKKLRREFENEIKQLKSGDNKFWSNMYKYLQFSIYYGICQFQTDQHFICIAIERQQYILLAWNIKDYQRYTLTMFKRKSFEEQLVQIKFINECLEL